jgi:uncharacterized protein involved in outer membrane biogenesis
MKKIAVIFLALIALAILIAAVAASQLDLSPYKGQIATAVKEKAGYDVKIDGDLKLSILPLPHVNVSGVNVYNGQDRLVAVKSVDVRVALLPLLSKQIEVESLILEGPEITLATDAAGKGNWVTDTMQAQKDAAAAAPSPAQPTQPGAAPAVTIKNIQIEDGAFSYRDGVTGVVRTVNVPNVKARADTLQGPFAVDGYLMVNQLPVAVKVQSGKLSDGKDASPIQVTLDMSNGGAHVEYDGVWQTAPALRLDGDIELNAENPRATLTELLGKDASLPDILDEAIGLAGRVTVSETAAELKEAQIKALGLQWQGQVAARGFGKDAVQQDFAVNLKSGDKAEGTGLKRLLAGSDIQVLASVADKNVTISRANITTADTAFDLTGKYIMPATAAAKPTLVLNGKVDRLNVDSLMGAALADMKAKKVASDVKDTAQEAATGKATVNGFTLPMNVQADLSVAKLTVKGKDITDLALNVAGEGSKMTITNLAFKTLADTTIGASGVIGNTQALSGLDINVTGQTGSVETLMQSFGQKTDELPVKIGAAGLKAKVTGSVDKLGFDGAVSALDAQVSAKGVASGLPGKVALADMIFGLKHPNLVKAIQIVKPDFAGDSYLQQPVDIRAGFSMGDKVIDITTLNGKLGPLNIEKAVLKVDQSGTVPSIAGSIALGDLRLPEGNKAAASSSGGGKAASAPAASAGKTRWSSAKMDLGFLRSAKVDLDATAKSITQGQWRLDNPATKVTMADGTLTIPSLTAGLFGGKVDLNGKLAQDTAGVISTNWKGSASGISGKTLLSALMSKPSNVLEGNIDTFAFDLNTGGLSQADLVNGLDGQLAVKGSNIVINGIDIPKLVSAFSNDFDAAIAVSSLLTSSLQKGSTKFDTLDATMPISNGVVSMNPTFLDSTQARMDITGTVSLPAWYMDLKADVKLKQPAEDPPTFNMLFKGPIDQPGKSIGQAALEHQLQKRLGKKVDKFLQKSEVGQKLNKMGLGGLLGGSQTQDAAPAPTTPTAPTAPATTDGAAAPTTQQAPSEQQQLTPEQQRQKAAEQLIKSLF